MKTPPSYIVFTHITYTIIYINKRRGATKILDVLQLHESLNTTPSEGIPKPQLSEKCIFGIIDS